MITYDICYYYYPDVIVIELRHREINQFTQIHIVRELGFESRQSGSQVPNS